MAIWIVQGDHPNVPGRSLSAFYSERSAHDEAASLVRIMQKDTEGEPTAATATWEECLQAMKDDGHDCDVWIIEIEPKD